MIRFHGLEEETLSCLFSCRPGGHLERRKSAVDVEATRAECRHGANQSAGEKRLRFSPPLFPLRLPENIPRIFNKKEYIPFPIHVQYIPWKSSTRIHIFAEYTQWNGIVSKLLYLGSSEYK